MTSNANVSVSPLAVAKANVIHSIITRCGTCGCVVAEKVVDEGEFNRIVALDDKSSDEGKNNGFSPSFVGEFESVDGTILKSFNLFRQDCDSCRE